MESKARATAAGAFVVLLVLMVIGTVLWFSQDQTVRVRYDIVTSRSLSGIAPQATVELYGINVGMVESVSFLSEKPGFARLRMLINQDAPINQSTFATLSSRGITGAVFVNLMDDAEAPLEQRKTLLQNLSGHEIPEIPLHAGTLEGFTESAQKMFARLDTTLENLNSWLSPENEQQFFVTIERFGDAANEVAKLGATLDAKTGVAIDQITQAVRNANSALDDVRRLAATADKAITGLAAPDGAIENINTGAQSLTNAARHLSAVTLPRINNTAQTVENVVKTANRLMQKIEGQPQSLLLGPGTQRPGPGETGHQSPY